jgi:hypothetical protein
LQVSTHPERLRECQNKAQQEDPCHEGNKQIEQEKLSPTHVTKLTPDQAKQFVRERTNSSDKEADYVLDSLRQEQHGQTKQDRKAS